MLAEQKASFRKAQLESRTQDGGGCLLHPFFPDIGTNPSVSIDKDPVGVGQGSPTLIPTGITDLKR